MGLVCAWYVTDELLLSISRKDLEESMSPSQLRPSGAIEGPEEPQSTAMLSGGL